VLQRVAACCSVRVFVSGVKPHTAKDVPHVTYRVAMMQKMPYLGTDCVPLKRFIISGSFAGRDEI